MEKLHPDKDPFALLCSHFLVVLAVGGWKPAQSRVMGACLQLAYAGAERSNVLKYSKAQLIKVLERDYSLPRRTASDAVAQLIESGELGIDPHTDTVRINPIPEHWLPAHQADQVRSLASRRWRTKSGELQREPEPIRQHPPDPGGGPPPKYGSTLPQNGSQSPQNGDVSPLFRGERGETKSNAGLGDGDSERERASARAAAAVDPNNCKIMSGLIDNWFGLRLKSSEIAELTRIATPHQVISLAKALKDRGTRIDSVGYFFKPLRELVARSSKVAQADGERIVAALAEQRKQRERYQQRLAEEANKLHAQQEQEREQEDAQHRKVIATHWARLDQLRVTRDELELWCTRLDGLDQVIAGQLDAINHETRAYWARALMGLTDERVDEMRTMVAREQRLAKLRQAARELIESFGSEGLPLDPKAASELLSESAAAEWRETLKLAAMKRWDVSTWPVKLLVPLIWALYEVDGMSTPSSELLGLLDEVQHA